MADDKEKVLILPKNFHLTCSNWIQWKSKILTIVELKGVLEHLDGTSTAPIPAADTPTPTEVKVLAKWGKDDLLAKATCTLNMDIESCGIEPQGKTAHEFWSALLAVKERRSELAIQNADEYLRSCKYVPGADIHAHIEELRRRCKACREIGSPLTNARFAIVICQSMGSTYDHITAPLLTRTDPEEVILTILAVHDNSMLQSGRPQNPLGDTLTTAAAGQTTSAFMTAAKAAMICDWCLWKGHTKERCYCQGGGMAGQQPSHWKSQPRPKRGSPADLAHPGTSTPNVNASANAAATTARPTTPAATPDYNVFHNVLLASAAPAMQNPTDGAIRAYLDSGASHHYFTDRSYFTEYLPLTPHSGNSAKRGADFTIIGVGSVNAEMVIEGRRSIVTFRNALHVPDLAANLISLSRIDGSGGNIQIGNGEMRIVGAHGGQPILVGKMTSNNLYEVILTRCDGNHVPAGDPSAFATLTNAKAADVHTWHRRFGHASERTVMEMSKSGAVMGMEVVGGLPQGKCEDCIKGKHPRAPFSSSNVEEEVLKRVYIDLTGRAREPSMGGAYHGMTIYDGASSYEECELLRTKEAAETLEAFKAYHKRAELQTGKKLCRIRTDNGPEFENVLWEAYTREHGIVHEPTTPYTPQQDGVAERGHRTLGDHARAMLFDAGLPVGLWAEAYKTATYVKNLTISARQKGHTPYEKWHGRVPNVAHLRAFGAIAWAKVPDETRSKLDPKSIRCVLVGYTESANYRLWDPIAGRVIRSRNVIFEEGRGHRTLTEVVSVRVNAEASVAGDAEVEAVEEVSQHDIEPEWVQVPAVQVVGETRTNAEAEAPRRSARATTPSQKLHESRESDEREVAARSKGEAWANEKVDAMRDSSSEGAYLAMFTAAAHAGQDGDVRWYRGGKTPESYKEACKTSAYLGGLVQGCERASRLYRPGATLVRCCQCCWVSPRRGEEPVEGSS